MRFKKLIGDTSHSERTKDFRKRHRRSSACHRLDGGKVNRKHLMSLAQKEFERISKDQSKRDIVCDSALPLTVANCLHVITVLECARLGVDPLYGLYQLVRNSGDSLNSNHPYYGTGSSDRHVDAGIAYRLALIKVHPDKNHHPESNRAFLIVQQAWNEVQKIGGR